MRAREVTIEWLREHVEGFEGSNGQYQCWCPVHDDVGSSMKGGSITVKPGGKILYKCHSAHCGATLTDVIRVTEGFDIEEEDDTPHVRVRSTKGKAGLAAWAHYTQVPAKIWEMLGCFDHGGNAVKFTFTDSDVIKIRAFPKSLHFEPKSAEISPLWPIPQDELPEHISITEGESDCGTTYAASLPPGFSVTKGSDTPLSVAVFEALASRGVRELTVYADADLSGEELRQRVTSLAIDAGLAVNVCDLTRIVDPFYPIKDLNSLWKYCDQDVNLFQMKVDQASYSVARGREFLTVEDILRMAEQDVNYLIPNLLAPQEKVLIWGPPKAYKTWLTLDLVRSLTTQAPFLNRAEWTPTRVCKTLLVEEEGTKELFAKRIRRLGLPDDAPFMLVHRKGIRFTEPDSISYIISVCREYEIDVCIFDPLQRMIPGVNENDASETGVVWDEIARIQQACPDLVVIVVHHGNKSALGGWGGSRGSSRHGGEVDLGIACEKHDVEEGVVKIWMDGRETNANLEPDASFKGKITITEEEFKIDATDVEVHVRKSNKEEQRDANMHAVFMAVRNGADTRTKIMHECNLSDVPVREHLQRLTEMDMVIEEVQGKGKPNLYKEKTDE